MKDRKHQRRVFQFLIPKFCKAKARFTATVDLPTPPFALETNKVNLVPLIGVFINCLGGGFLLIMFKYFGHNIAIT